MNGRRPESDEEHDADQREAYPPRTRDTCMVPPTANQVAKELRCPDFVQPLHNVALIPLSQRTHGWQPRRHNVVGLCNLCANGG